MIFDENTFRETLRGACSVYTDESGGIRAKRFTDYQKEVIAEKCPTVPFHNAGMRFDFITDAADISMSFRYARITSRIFASIDVYEDGVLIYAFREKNTFDNKEGSFDCHFEKNGKKRVTVYLPYTCDLSFDKIELTGESFVLPYTNYSGYIYMMGDSITHGYDADTTSLTYANIVMRRLDLDGINQGAAGYVFCARSLDPALFEGKRGPDVITIAYGTNDWAGKTKEDFCRDIDEFFIRLREIYPSTPVIVITPIWRAGYYLITKVGEFEFCREYLTSAAKKHEGVYVLDGDKLVPHSYDYFRDVRVHPNDAGFATYGTGVADAVARVLNIKPKTFLI